MPTISLYRACFSWVYRFLVGYSHLVDVQERFELNNDDDDDDDGKMHLFQLNASHRHLVQYVISPEHPGLCAHWWQTIPYSLQLGAGIIGGPWEETHPEPASSSLKAHVPPHVSGRLSDSHQDAFPPREPATSASHHGVRAFNWSKGI